MYSRAAKKLLTRPTAGQTGYNREHDRDSQPHQKFRFPCSTETEDFFRFVTPSAVASLWRSTDTGKHAPNFMETV